MARPRTYESKRTLTSAGELSSLRRDLRTLLAGCHEHVVTDAELVVNELATLALSVSAEPVRIGLTLTPGQCVRIELDGVPAELVPEDSGQRTGVELVTSLAAASDLDGTDGATRWVELDLTAPSREQRSHDEEPSVRVIR
ncbi:hypothetical protein [Prauserella cavernicola]|uniref:ATP-binding protein n=1 Tax=Prauserella cavernicola TaxID=2800127 RepID=A0A934R1B8_9PSEU|nr:hypothetical protein [Prauserella cavernicola]MBK1789074.1 hypothetical protein [Prauserella cavernicola]